MRFSLPDIKNFSQRQTFILIGIIALLTGLSILVFFNLRPKTAGEIAKLTVWGIENRDAFEASFEKFRGANPGIDISYRRLDPETYEDTLINALAAGSGPDIFMFANSWLSKNKSKIIPAPPDIMNMLTFQQLYPQIAEQNFTDGQRIYALPLSIDTLALFYNKNIFDQAGVTATPKTWDQVRDVIDKIRITDTNGQIIRAGIALGGSKKTIKNAPEIVSCMMLQTAALDPRAIDTKEIFTNPAGEAANQYLQFANPIQPFYTWNDTQPNALESFSAQKTAMLIGYKSDLKDIKEKNLYLNVGITQLPQPDNTQNITSCAKYWGLAVSKQTRNSQWAWKLVQALATDPDAGYGYAIVANRTPALRSLIANQIQNPQESIFARQALTARGWNDPDAKKTNEIINNMIVNVLSGQIDFSGGYSQAKSQIEQLRRQ